MQYIHVLVRTRDTYHSSQLICGFDVRVIFLTFLETLPSVITAASRGPSLGC